MKNIFYSLIAVLLITLLQSGNHDCLAAGSGAIPKENEVKLIESIQNGEHDTIESLLKDIPDVNFKVRKGFTPLMAAAEFGDSYPVRLLIKRGAEVNAVNSLGKTALILSTNYGFVDNARELISAGADIDARDDIYKMSAFLYSVKFGFIEMAKLLVDNKADIRLLDCFGNNALAIAVRHNNAEMVRYLIGLKFDPNGLMIEKEGETILMYAAGKGMYNIVKLLIESGADVNKKTVYNFSALVYAAVCGVESVEDLIVEKSSGVDGEQGTYALGIAVLSENNSMIEKLIKKGADPDKAYKTVQSESFYDADPVNGLVEKIINNGVAAGRDYTPLMIACVTGNLRAVKKLIEYGAGIDRVEEGCHTPLMASLNFENFDIARFLIERGANVNAKNACGETPLALAAYLRDYDTVKILLERGAKFENTAGREPNAALIALNSGDEKLFKLFADRGADALQLLGSARGRFESPMQKAIDSENTPLLKLILRSGADANERLEFGPTPLSLAARGGNYEAAKVLIDGGANVDNATSSYEGGTALDIAAQSGSDEIVKLLMERGHPFDSAKLERLAGEPNDRQSNLADSLGLEPRRYYSSKPWNIKGFPSKIRKIINDDYGYKNKIERGEIVRETLPVAISENIDITGPLQMTALQYFASRIEIAPPNNSIIKLLIENKADLYIGGKEKSPFISIIERGNREIYDYLIEKGYEIKIDEKELSLMIVNQASHVTGDFERLKILLDIARRKKYSLAGSDEIWKAIIFSHGPQTIKYIFENKLFGIEKAGTYAVDLVCSTVENTGWPGLLSDRLTNALYIAKLTGEPCKSIVNSIEKSAKLSSMTAEITLAAARAKNVECVRYFSKRIKTENNYVFDNIIQSLIYDRYETTPEAENLKASLELIENPDFKFDSERKKRNIQKLIPEMIKLKLNEEVKSFMAKNGFEDTQLNQAMILASVSSGNFSMNRFLMINLPLGQKIMLTELLLNKKNQEDTSEERRRKDEDDPAHRAFLRVYESIRPGAFAEFKKALEAAGAEKFDPGSYRSFFQKALECRNDEIAKYLIDNTVDFYDRYFVESSVSAERFDLADLAMAKGAAIADPEYSYFFAIRDNKISIIDYLLKNKIDPNCSYSNEGPIVAVALKWNRPEIFIKLVEGGADLVKGRFKKGAGDFFGLSGRFSFSGMDTWVKPPNDSTLLNYAIAGGMRREALFLSSREPGINIVDPLSGKCALELAIERNYTGIALAILKRADIDLKSANVKTALAKAVETGNAAVIRRFSEIGVTACDDFDAKTLKRLISEKKEYIYAITGAMTAKNTAASKILKSLLTAGASTSEILICSVKMNNIALTKSYLASAGSAGAAGEAGRGALISAVEDGNLEAVRLLLENGADANSVDFFKTPLAVAAVKSGRIDILKALEKAGANLGAASPFGIDPLYASLAGGDDVILNYLMSQKVNPEKALIKSIQNLKSGFVAKLLGKGAVPDACDNRGVNALLLARGTLQYDLEDMLVKYGADANFEPENIAAIKIFNIIASGDNGKTALNLVAKVKDLEEKNDAGETLLVASLKKWNMNELSLALVQAGADLSAVDSSNTTALMYIMQKNIKDFDYKRYVTKLKNAGHVNNEGKNILFFYEGEKTEEVELLLKCGANIVQKDNSGMTPLLNFISGRRLFLADWLIKRGADVRVKNRSGENALMLMSQKCDGMIYEQKKLSEEMIDGFIARMKNMIDDRDRNGETALMMAARYSLPYFVKAFIKAGADVNARDSAGNCALIKACDRESAAALIEAGASPVTGPKGFDDIEALQRLLSDKHGEKNFGALRLILDREISRADEVDEKTAADFLKANHSNGLKSLIYLASKKNVRQDRFFEMLFGKFNIDEKILYKSILEAGSGEQLKCFSDTRKNLKLSEDGWNEIMTLLKAGNKDILKTFLDVHKKFDNKILSNAVKMSFYNKMPEAAREFITRIEVIEAGLADEFCREFIQFEDTQGISLVFKRSSVPETESDFKLKIFMQSLQLRNNYIARSYFDNDPQFYLSAKAPDGLPLFIHACKSGNLELAKAMKKAGADPDMKGSEGRTALYFAALNGDMPMIKFLEESGADLNIKNDKESIAILSASNGGSVEAVKYFQSKGQSINYKNKFGLTPLIVSIMAGKKDAAKYLIESGAELNCLYDEGRQGSWTPLGAAMNNGDFDTIKLLIEKGSSINEIIGMKIAAEGIIEKAVERKRPDMIKFLIDRGFDINKIYNSSFNALHFAAMRNDLEMVKDLLEMGFLIDAKSSDNRTALSLALNNENVEMAKYLFSKGASVKIHEKHEAASFEKALKCGCEEIAAKIMRSSDKKTIFLPALIKFKRLDSIKKIIESEGSVNFDAGGSPLVVHAAGEGAIEILSFLIEKKADINVKNVFGRTPLLKAALVGRFDVAKFLVEKGADINAKDKDRNTALILSALSGNADLVRFFMEKGQNPNQQNKNGLTPLIAACKSRSAETVRLLLSAGAKPDGYYSYSGDRPGCALYYGVEKNSLEIVKALIEAGANLKTFAALEAFNYSLNNCMNNEICKVFIEAGIDFNKSSDCSNYPLFHAVENMRLREIKYFIQNGLRFDTSEVKTIKLMELEKQSHRSAAFSMLRKAAESVPKDIAREKIAALNRAITAGENTKAVELLKGSFEVDIRDERYCTPLFTAVETGSVGIAEALLKRGANPNMSGIKDLRPLTLAVRSKKIELVKLLVEGGADINFTDDFNTLPLVRAVINGSTDIFEYLLERGAGIDLCSNDGHTPLTAAAACGRDEMIRKLLKKGADVKIRNRMDDTAITTAAADGHWVTAELLSEMGSAEIEDRNAREYFQFCKAIAKGATAEVEALIRKGSDVNCSGKDLLTPLMIAAGKRNIAIMRLLVENGARIDAGDASGKTFLEHYLQSSTGKFDDEFITYLSELNISEDSKEKIILSCDSHDPALAIKFIAPSESGKTFGEFGRSRLMTAIASEKYNIALELIKAGADVKFKDKNGSNALILLCKSYFNNSREKFYSLVASRLIEAGSPINDQDAEGNTALHYAAHRGLGRTVEMLIERGAGVNIKNKKGETPFTMALKFYPYSDCLLKMISAGAEIFPGGAGSVLSAEYVNLLALNADGKVTKIIIDRYLDENKGMAEETVARILKLEPVRGIPAALYAAQKGGLNAEATYNKYFYKADLGNAKTVQFLIELGNAEYLSLFRKKGLKLVIKYNPVVGLMLALKNRNYEAAAIMLREGYINDAGVNQAVVASLKDRDDMAVKLILNSAPTVEIYFKNSYSLLENFIEKVDAEGILLLAERKKNAQDKLSFYEMTLERIIENKKVAESFFGEFFEKFRRDCSADIKPFAVRFMQKAIDNEKYNIFFYVDNLFKAGRKTYNSQALVIAAAAGQIALVKKLLKNGAYPDSIDEMGNFALQRAIDNRKFDVMKIIAESGADLKGRPGAAALTSAIAAGSTDAVAYLLKKGADPNASAGVKSCLQQAVLMNRPDMLEKLIAAGAFFDPASPPGLELFQAASKNDDGKLLSILKKGPRPDVAKKFEPSIKLNELIRTGDLKNLNSLVESVRYVDYRDENGNTLLNNAIARCRFEVANALIAKGADINAKNKEGRTPLINSILIDNASLAKLLLEKGADYGLKDDNGRDALNWAILKGDEVLCEVILKSTKKKGVASIVMPVHFKAAEENESIEIKEILIEHSHPAASQGKSFAEKRRLAATLTDAVLAGDTAAVTLIMNNSAPQKINQDKLIFLLKKTSEAGNVEMASIIGRYISDFQKILFYIRSLILDGESKSAALEAILRSLPDRAFEKDAVNLIREMMQSKNTKCLDLLLEKAMKHINSFELNSIIQDSALTGDKEIVKPFLKRLGSFREPACAAFFCEALRSGDAQSAKFCLIMKFDFSKSEFMEYHEILKALGRYADPLLIKAFSNNIDMKIFGLNIFIEALKARRIDNMQQLIELGVNPVLPEMRYILRDTLIAKDYASAVFLLSSGVDPDVRDFDGFNALMHAAMTDEIELAETAIEKGTNLALTNEFGETALDIARVFKSHGVEKIIESSKDAKNEPVNDVYRLMGMLAAGESDEVLIEAINGGFNVNECTISRKVLLQRAIELKRCRVVEALLDAGASLLIRRNDGSTPLGFAMAQSDEKIIASIVSGAGGINSMLSDGETMLSFAAKGDCYESALILLKMKADPAAKNGYGKTAAEIAREYGKLEMLRYFEDTDIVNILSRIDEIIEKSMVRKNLISAEIEFRGAGGKTALMDAIEKNQTLRIKYLLVNGANARAADGSGKTVHQYALGKDSREITNLIGLYSTIKPDDARKIERGKDYISAASSSSVTIVFQPKTETDILNQELLSALTLPLGPGFNKLGQIKALIEKGADVNYAIPPYETTPLMEIIKQSEIDIAKMLIDKGANINAVDKNSRSAFLLACESQNIDIIKLFIDKGFDLNSANGRNGFVQAAFSGNIDIIKFLIEKGADVNAKNSRGFTALIMAVKASKAGVVKFLNEKGADISIKDPSGKTAADYAASSGNKTLIDLLKK
jgi:ankyrin repeat protein